jgi:hypothetical protein
VSRIEILAPDGIPGPGRQHRTRELVGNLAPRLSALAGRTVALHDNAKPGSRELLTAIGEGLAGHGADLRRWSKAHAARPSPHVPELAVSADAAVFALGD